MVLLLGCADLFHLFNKSFQSGFVFSLLITLSLLAYGYYRYQHPVTKVINIVFNKPTVEPETSFKIVAVSDVHLGLGTVKSKLAKYVEMINKQEPDVILICGDLIDNSIVPVIDQQMHTELSLLKARYGVYMVVGNHEYISGIDECMRFLEQTPVQVLRDTVVTFPNGVQLIGRDDRNNRSRATLTQLMRDIDPSRPVIVLDHQPVEIDRVVEAGVDLLLCGHTHNGQVWPLNLLTKSMFDISYGYEKRGQTHIYVTSGLSLWGPPFRIGTQSEIVVIQLRM
jgi:predicted MPP superfamily phosphohydrolase